MAIKKTHKGTAPAYGGSSASVNPSIFDPKDPQHSAVITAVVKMKRKDGEGKFTAVTCEIDHGPLSGKTIKRLMTTESLAKFGKLRKAFENRNAFLPSLLMTMVTSPSEKVSLRAG